ncbi:MAG: hypothetical protein DI537_17420 [Stutzerimonas stutzeri]|nr:MAG: hypothetical protein DI537_17420 [Stutzerimonas stutzeri]
MQIQTLTAVAPSRQIAIRSAAVSISRRASRHPILRNYVIQPLAAVNRLRDKQRCLQSRVEIAREKLAEIRFNGLARHTKKGLIAYLTACACDEFAIDRLGELAIDLNHDLSRAKTLRDGRAIRKMLRSKI